MSIFTNRHLDIIKGMMYGEQVVTGESLILSTNKLLARTAPSQRCPQVSIPSLASPSNPCYKESWSVVFVLCGIHVSGEGGFVLNHALWYRRVSLGMVFALVGTLVF